MSRDRRYRYDVTLPSGTYAVQAVYDDGDASVGLAGGLYLDAVTDAAGRAAWPLDGGPDYATAEAALLAPARALYADEEARAAASEDAQAAHEMATRAKRPSRPRVLLAIVEALRPVRSGALRGTGAEQSAARAEAIEAALALIDEATS